MNLCKYVIPPPSRKGVIGNFFHIKTFLYETINYMYCHYYLFYYYLFYNKNQLQSESTMSFTISSNVYDGFHPSSIRALVLSPNNISTSVGRK